MKIISLLCIIYMIVNDIECIHAYFGMINCNQCDSLKLMDLYLCMRKISEPSAIILWYQLKTIETRGPQ